MHAPASDLSVEALCDALAKLPTAVVSDVLETVGLKYQVLATTIRAVGMSHSFAGPALCLAGSEGPEASPLPGGSRPVFETDRHVHRGCVVVIAAEGHAMGAVIGGNVALSWRRRGCAGVVTDGGVRDIAECNDLSLPVFATFVGPMSNKGLWAFRQIEVPVILPGQRGKPVTIHPGDLVHGDIDGAVIIPASLAHQVVRDAVILEEIEGRIRADLKKGDDREAVYGRHNRFAHIKAVPPQ
jgi:regulator of RNase E activity RraA